MSALTLTESCLQVVDQHSLALVDSKQLLKLCHLRLSCLDKLVVVVFKFNDRRGLQIVLVLNLAAAGKQPFIC